MIFNNHRCLRCGTCVGSCPTNSIFLHETTGIAFTETCIECALCIVVCPVGSISRTPGTNAEPVCRPAQESRV